MFEENNILVCCLSQIFIFRLISRVSFYVVHFPELLVLIVR